MSRIRRALLVLATTLVPGCLAPRFLGLDEPYGDSPFTAAYAGVYDAAVVAHGYPVPLLLGPGLEPGSPGWELVTTTTLPISLVVAAVGGTLALPVLLLLQALH
jgi:hypothetical protein